MRIRDWSSDVCSSDLEASMRPGAQEPYHATFGGANRQANIAMLASREEDIAALQHEMQVLHGRFDQVIPLVSSVRLATLLPRADLNVFGACGHRSERHTSEVQSLIGILSAVLCVAKKVQKQVTHHQSK